VATTVAQAAAGMWVAAGMLPPAASTSAQLHMCF
jgi:hypothetical protein